MYKLGLQILIQEQQQNYRMKMQRYRRRTLKMSLNKITSSLPAKRQHVAHTQFNLQHFYLSKSQICGKDNSKTQPNQRDQSNRSVNNVINKLQDTKTAADWLRQTKALKKRQNMVRPIFVTKTTSSDSIFGQNHFVTPLNQLKFDVNESFPQLLTKKFIIKSTKNHKSKDHYNLMHNLRNNAQKCSQFTRELKPWQTKDDLFDILKQ